MAVGDNYSNNKQQQRSPEVFSFYTMSNAEGIDPSMLSISYWNGLMKVSISPMLPNPTTEHKWDKDNAIAAYVNHTKARTLAWVISDVLDPNKPDVHSGGINTGTDGLICFSDGKEVGLDHPCIIIRKIDPNDGHVISSYIYEFKFNYHYAIVNYNPNDASHKKIYYDDIEVSQFVEVLNEYYKAMTNAVAYTVIDRSKYDTSRINTKLDSICENLGIDYRDGKANYSRKGGSSYFNKSNGEGSTPSSATSRAATMDEIDNALNASE